MPTERKFEVQLAATDALRHQPPERSLDPLRKALTHRNNFVAAKAADLVRQLELTQLTPDLLTAFDRFFEDAVKTDPQCWAKNAISAALAQFDHQDPDLFLRGMKHTQPEPSYGGPSDSAATLRAPYALALVQCPRLPEPDLLTHLIDFLDDKEKSFRVQAHPATQPLTST